MRVFVLLFVLLMSAPAWADRDNLFWRDAWPEGVPDPTKWALSPELNLVESRQVALANVRLVFELHAQPERPVLWQVGRFRICYNGQLRDPETVVWLKPNSSAQVFYRFERRTWKKLWLGHELYWYRLPEESPEYKAELNNARKIFYLARWLHENDPFYWGKLTF